MKGRLKGSKTKKKRNKPRKKKKRGRKGLYTVFDKGKIGYTKINNSIYIQKNISF